MPIVILLDDSIYLSNENIPLKTPGNRFLTKCLKIAKKVQKIQPYVMNFTIHSLKIES